MRYSLKQLRVIIVLMSINAFALFVNYVGIGIPLHSKDSDKHFYLLTNSSGKIHSYNNYYYSNKSYYSSHFISFDYNNHYFYPFVEFREGYDYYNKDYGKEGKGVRVKESTFRGVFTYYDFTEFFVYTILIFGVPFVYNYVKKREAEELNK